MTDPTSLSSDTGLRIVKLQAENVKRLKAVEITPDGNLVVIAGRNAQGKTSVLDAIWFALGGGQAQKATTRPIRDGEDHASVTLDLGDLVVTRTWSGEKTALKVESKDGARYSSPQSMLDNLVGRLSFDPLAFAHQDEKQQLATLIGLVDLPFDPAVLDGRRRALYEERTEVGRRGKALEGQLAGMPAPAPGLPEAEVSVAALVAEHQAAREQLARNERVRDVAVEDLERVERAETRVADLERQLEIAREELHAARKSALDSAASTADLVDPDIASIEERLATVEQVNAKVRAAAQRREVAEEHAKARASYDALTAQIDALDQQKAQAIKDAAMPIPGLGFDDNGVTYQGVPLKQASGAEQLRVSLAMAMALNPRIRVIRITDGSLLDSTNLALIEEMAADRGFQVWIERVDESGSVGVVIEDGLVAGAETHLEAVPA